LGPHQTAWPAKLAQTRLDGSSQSSSDICARAQRRFQSVGWF
jgi:hypothetical protein